MQWSSRLCVATELNAPVTRSIAFMIRHEEERY